MATTRRKNTARRFGMSSFDAFLARFGLLGGPSRPSIEAALPKRSEDLLDFARENLEWLRTKRDEYESNGRKFDPWILRTFPELRDEL